MPIYLSTFTGKGTKKDSFKPIGWDTSDFWSIFDLRKDPTNVDGTCLVYFPDFRQRKLLKLADSPSEKLSTYSVNMLGASSIPNFLFSRVPKTSNQVCLGDTWTKLPNGEIIFGSPKLAFFPIAKDNFEPGKLLKIASVALLTAGIYHIDPRFLPFLGVLPATDDFAGTGALSASWTAQVITALHTNSRSVGQAKGDALSGDCTSFWNADVFSNDQYGQIVVSVVSSTAGAGGFVGALTRASGTGAGTNQYQYFTNGASGTNNTGIQKYVAGTNTTILNVSASFVANDILKGSAVGSIMTFFKNGANVASVTDTSLTSGSAGISTFDGAGAGANNARLDNWEGGNVSLGLHLLPLIGVGR